MYGNVIKINVLDDKKTNFIVFMDDIVDCKNCVDSLNGQTYNENQDILQIKFQDKENSNEIIKRCLPTSINNLSNFITKKNGNVNIYGNESSKGDSDPNANISAKLTCRYEIHQKELGPAFDFQLSKKIIGPKGSNMKKVLENCLRGCKSKEPDLLKLRQRGIGSGFKEGPHDEECDEPLHLCISAKYQDIYYKATRSAEDLLLMIFEDFNQYLSNSYNERYSIPLVLKKEGNSSPTIRVVYPLIQNIANAERHLMGRIPEVKDKNGKVIQLFPNLNEKK